MIKEAEEKYLQVHWQLHIFGRGNEAHAVNRDDVLVRTSVVFSCEMCEMYSVCWNSNIVSV